MTYYLLLYESNTRQLVFIEEPENGRYHQNLLDLDQNRSPSFQRMLHELRSRIETE